MERARPGRAPRGARSLALLAGGVTVLVVALPLAAGYAGVLGTLARQLAAAGELPAPSFWAPWPLHAGRLAVLLLFALDLGLWIALLGLLPVEDVPAAPFLSLRRRLRRHWLVGMTPLYPVAAALAGARLLARAAATTGTGATWFLPGVLGIDHGAAARAWIAGERGLLAFFAAAFLLHLLVLAGPSRPWKWLSRVVVLAVAEAALLLVGIGVVLPLVVGPPWTAAATARRELLDAFPGLADLDPLARDDLAWNAFTRTAADGPALRGHPPASLPPAVVALPPVPLAGLDGVPFLLEGPAAEGATTSRGLEWRVPLDGDPVSLPLPRPFRRTCVLKADRALRWRRVLEMLRDLGPGPLRVGVHPAPCGPPRAVPPGAVPVLVLRQGGTAAEPPGAARVPLPFPPGILLRPEPSGAPPWPGRTRPGRRDLYVRERPDDVLWHRALPLPVPVPPDEGGTVRLLVSPGTPWDDVARALVAETLAGARRIELVTPPETGG